MKKEKNIFCEKSLKQFVKAYVDFNVSFFSTKPAYNDPQQESALYEKMLSYDNAPSYPHRQNPFDLLRNAKEILPKAGIAEVINRVFTEQEPLQPILTIGVIAATLTQDLTYRKEGRDGVLSREGEHHIIKEGLKDLIDGKLQDNSLSKYTDGGIAVSKDTVKWIFDKVATGMGISDDDKAKPEFLEPLSVLKNLLNEVSVKKNGWFR